MATRALIGLEYPDGNIKFIYCHSDGDIKHTGKILKKFKRDDFENLMEQNPIRFLGGRKRGSTDINSGNVPYYSTGETEEVYVATDRVDYNNNNISNIEWMYLYSKDNKLLYKNNGWELLTHKIIKEGIEGIECDIPLF